MNYYDIDRLSRSTLCDLKISPYYFWSHNIAKTIEIDSPAMSFGRAFHCAVLEPDEFENRYTFSPKINKRTKEGKIEYAEFEEKNKGKDILCTKDQELLEKMAMELGKYQPAIDLLTACEKREYEYYFTYLDHQMKAKIDAVSVNKNIIIDLKTVCDSKRENNFISELFKYNYAEQVFLYSHAFELEYGTRPTFIIISISKKEPFEIKISDASSFYDYGKNSIDKLIEKYEECVSKWGLDINIPWRDDSIIRLEPPTWCKNIIDEEEEND